MIKISSASQIKKLTEIIASEFTDKIIPLDKITESEDLMVFYDHYEKGTFDGMTVYDSEDFFIHINIDNGNKIDSPRSRFTLAHELGHYFIDSHRIGLKQGLLQPHPSNIDEPQYYKIENEADYFAACLLMPEDTFKKDLKSYRKFNFNVISDLSTKYHVSKIACALRFSEIGNHPIKIIYAENGFIKWSTNSYDFPYWKLITTPKVPEGLIMSDYFNNVTTEIYKTEEIFATDCFDGIRKEDSKKIFYEHCITHKNCALSIIWED